MHSLTSPLLALALLTAPNTDRADCGNLNDRYAAAAVKVIAALHRYERCVAANVQPDGRRPAKPDDCADEMQALDDAHDNFVDAVADAKNCR